MCAVLMARARRPKLQYIKNRDRWETIGSVQISRRPNNRVADSKRRNKAITMERHAILARGRESGQSIDTYIFIFAIKEESLARSCAARRDTCESTEYIYFFSVFRALVEAWHFKTLISDVTNRDRKRSRFVSLRLSGFALSRRVSFPRKINGIKKKETSSYHK